MNGLPEGFVIDQPAVAPPEGFVIDQGGASSMGGRAPQVDAYQPGVAWNEQPFRYRTQYEQKAEDELTGRGGGVADFMSGLYGRKQPVTADQVSARAEEMAKASGYAPSFGDWEERKAPDGRTIMNAGNPGMMIESRGVWEPKTYVEDGDKLIDLKRPKMGAGEAVAKGSVDIAQMTPGIKSIASTLATPETNPYREGYGQTKTAGDLGRDWDAEAKRALEDQPLAFMGGQAVSLLAGGQGAFYEKGVQLAPRVIAPRLAAKAGPAAKFTGRVAAHSFVGALDYGLFEGIAGANNDARLDGGTSADVTLGDRAGKFAETMTNPLSYAFGPATLGVSRLGTGLVNSSKNSVRASIEAGAPRLRGGDMTPRSVQAAQLAPHKSLGDAYTAGLERVLADNPNPQLLTALENTPFLKKMVTLKQDGSPLPEGMTQDYVDAIKHALKRGLNPDQIEAVMKAYHYGGYGSVDEALGLLSNSSKVRGLNVTLSNIPGDAQEAWRDFFQAYRENSPEVVQRLLSRATGVDANDYAGFVKDLERKKVSEASPLYEASASKPVSPETWDSQILPAILRFDGGPRAIREAAGEVASGQHPGSLEAASELHRLADQVEAIHKQAADAGFAGGLLPSGHIAELSQQVGSAVARPDQVSTRALIELDKFLGGRAKSISKDRPELAGKYRNTSAEIRGTGRTSGLDPETGYNEGRAVSRSYKTAIEAAEAGSKAFGNGKTLRTLVDDIKLQIDGEMDDLGKAALLMGWMRSAEDAIDSSGGSAQVISRLYGSANQRKKMLAMIPAPKNSDETKRVQALTGQPKRKLDGQPAPVKSIFDRQRAVLNAEKGMTGGSPTAPKAAAIFGESEVTRFIDGVFDVVLNPVGSAKTLTRKVTHAIAKPPVYKEGVNRELGNIMTTTGKQGIEKRLADIRKVQGMNPPRGGRAPNALATPPKGPVRGAGVGGNTPKRGAKRLGRGLADMMSENEGASLVVARASGDKGTISAVTKQAQERATTSAKEMLQSGSAPQAVWDKTGVVPITYEGKTLLVHSKDGPDQVYREFYQNIDKPLLKRPDWMRGFRSKADTDAAAKYRAEMDAINPPLELSKDAIVKPGRPVREVNGRWVKGPDGGVRFEKAKGKGGVGKAADTLLGLSAPAAAMGLTKTLADRENAPQGITEKQVGNALAKASDYTNTKAEQAGNALAQRLRTAELPKRPIDLLKESEMKRNRKGQFVREMETKRKNDELWRRHGYTGYQGRKMTPEEARAAKGPVRVDEAPPSTLRPFSPGERRENADGTYSTEITTTWQEPDGSWVNVPSLWMGPNGKPKQFDESDEEGILGAMREHERKNGKSFQRFKSLEDAETSARSRSKQGGAGAGARVNPKPVPNALAGPPL